MKMRIIFLLLTMAVLTSCNKEDEVKLDNQLTGTWNLRTVTGYIDDFLCEYNDGDITWTIEEDKITVTNSLPSGFSCGTLESGLYNYSVSERNGFQFIKINEIEYGGYTIENNKWRINQGLGLLPGEMNGNELVIELTR